jgi:hypothetical protein
MNNKTKMKKKKKSSVGNKSSWASPKRDCFSNACELGSLGHEIRKGPARHNYDLRLRPGGLNVNICQGILLVTA